jgi:outer membrane biogenesis lipoprotein LolB
VRRHKSIFVLFSLACVLALAGCMPRPSVVERPKPPGVEELRAKLRARLDHWPSYKAVLYTKIESPKGSFSSRMVVLAKPPDMLHLEAFNLFGQTSGLLILNAEGAKLWTPSEKVLYVAEKPETLIQRLLGVSIPLETFEYALTACVTPGQLERLKVAAKNDRYIGYSEDDSQGWSFIWDFSPQPLALRSTEVTEGPWKYSISYDPAVNLDSDTIPGKIRLQSSEWRMGITVKQLVSAPELSSDTFNPRFPPGLRTISLDATR